MGARRGFLMAAVGSAVGLGNMWRFPYLVAENGGAAFVLLYLAIMLVVGLPLLLAELVIGRGARKSPIGAFVHFGGRAWAPLGILIVAAIFLTSSYYFVIAGWTLRYAVESIAIGFPGEPDAHFERISTGAAAIGWHLGFVALTVFVVLGGVRAGIERLGRVLMPLLLVILSGIALYAATLPGSGAGYQFYLAPDFATLFSWKVLSDAASQAFFSLGIGAGMLLTFASYLDEGENLPNAAVVIAISDFGVAFLAGLAVFPLIFALGLSGMLTESPLGALFITLPSAFAEMGAAGSFVSPLFFLALAMAALTTTVAALEVLVAAAIDGLGWQRRRAVLVIGGTLSVIGIGPALDLRVLAWVDKLVDHLVLVAAGLALAIFAGWYMKEPIAEASKGAEGIRWFVLWRWLLRIPVPLGLLLVLFASIQLLSE